MPTSPLLRRVRMVNPQQWIIKIVKDIRDALDESGRDGLLFRVTDTISSMVLATLAVKAVRPHEIRTVYFIQSRRYRMPPDLNRLLDYLRVRYEYIEIGSITKTIKNYMTGYTNINIEDIRETLSALILREISNKHRLLLLGETNKTMWLLGAFNPIYTKTMDLLPLTTIYSSQLRKVAAELHIMPYIRRAREPESWTRFKTALGIVDDEVIDAILYGISRNKTDREIMEGLDNHVSESMVREVRRHVEEGFLKRNGPLVTL